MIRIQSPINIVIADDHELIRNGFKVMLKRDLTISLVGEATNGRELIQLVEALRPDVVFTDIKMPIMNGIEATTILNRDFPEIPVVALSMFDEDALISQMIKAGAKGYMLKGVRKEDIIVAAKTVFEGGVYYCNTINHHFNTRTLAHQLQQSKIEKPISFLDVELAIMKLICQQYSNKQIAAALHLGVRTVENHRDRIFQKIDATNMAGVVIYAIKHGIFKLNDGN